MKSLRAAERGERLRVPLRVAASPRPGHERASAHPLTCNSDWPTCVAARRTCPQGCPTCRRKVANQLHTALEELRVAEEELRQQNEQLAVANEAALVQRRRYQELFDFAPDVYLVTDAQGNIQEANRAALTRLQVRALSVAGKPLIVFIAADARRAFSALLARLRQGEEVRGEELRIRPRRGEPFPAVLYVAAAHDAAGRLVALRWLLHDVAALHEARRRLVQAERLAAIGQMVAGLAHESRNALQRSQACLEMLALQLDNQPRALNLVGRIQKANDDLHRLYEEVRGYSAPSSSNRSRAR